MLDACLSSPPTLPPSARAETWQPTWTHDKILVGLLSFMTGTDSTVGAVMTSDDVKRRYAQESLGYNCRDKDFVALFPHLVTKHEAAQREAGANGGGDALNSGAGSRSGAGGGEGGLSSQAKYLLITVGILVMLLVAIKVWGGGDEDYGHIPDF